MIKLAKRQKARETDDLYRVVGFTKNDGGSLINQQHLQNMAPPKPTDRAHIWKGEIGEMVGHKTKGTVKPKGPT